jgi:hypothetical protein
MSRRELPRLDERSPGTDKVWEIMGRPNRSANRTPTHPSSPQVTTLPNITDKNSRKETPATPKRNYVPASDPPLIEQASRIRELELQIMYMKGDFDRRLNAVFDELPYKIHNEIKLVKERDSLVNRESSNPVQQAEIQNLASSLKQSFDSISDDMIALRDKLSSVEGKYNSAVMEIEKMKQDMNQQPSYMEVSEVNSIVHSMRQAIFEETKRRDALKQEFQQQLAELRAVIRAQEQELSLRFLQTREDLISLHAENKLQNVTSEKTIDDRMKSDQQYIRNVYENLEQRMSIEATQRRQAENEYKIWTDGRLKHVFDYLKDDSRELVQRERVLVGMVHEGITTLHEIINRARDATSVHISKVQTLLTENVKDVTSALASIKDNVYSKIGNLETWLQEEGKLRVQQQNAIQKTFTSIANAMEQNNTQIGNQITNVESAFKAAIFKMKEEITENEEKYSKQHREMETKVAQGFSDTFVAVNRVKENMIAQFKMSESKLAEVADNVREGFRVKNDEILELRKGIVKLEQETTAKLEQEVKEIKENMEKDKAYIIERIDDITGNNDKSLRQKIQETESTLRDEMTNLIMAESSDRSNHIRHVNTTLTKAIDKLSEEHTSRMINIENSIQETSNKLTSDRKKSVSKLREILTKSISSNMDAVIKKFLEVNEELRKLENGINETISALNLYKQETNLDLDDLESKLLHKINDTRTSLEVRATMDNMLVRLGERLTTENIHKVHEDVTAKLKDLSQTNVRQINALKVFLEQRIYDVNYETNCRLEANVCVDKIIGVLENFEAKENVLKLYRDIKTMNTSLDNLQQATEGHLNEQREVIFRKLNNLKGDLETHIEAIEQVQDSHTISIEDMEVRGTIDAMVRTLEKPEMYGLKTSASILMDEMNKIKKSFPSVQEQVEVIIANFKELSEQAQTLSEGLATERLLNKASEENLYKSIEKIGRAHDKLEAIIGNMEPDRVDVTPRVMNIENQLGFIYKTLKQYEKDSENLNGLAQKIEHLKMNNDERSAEVLNIMSNQAQLLTEIGNLQSSLASDSSPNSSNSGKLREEISRRMIQLQESFSSALSRALNK